MPDIRYVSLSDTHFGERGSLLTSLRADSSDVDPTRPSPVAERLIECLRYLVSRNKDGKMPTLILNGDILELAFATTDQAAMVFERFVDLIMPPGGELFEEIIYVPGNHDHHLWETARETQYVNHITSSIKPGQRLPVPWNATLMFQRGNARPVPSHFLTSLIQRFPHLRGRVITTAYPNFGLFQEDVQKCVVFHHGHFAEPLYQLVSILMDFLVPGRDRPKQVWDIEAENFAWIDFFWSMLGQSGNAGEQMELIYKTANDRKQSKKWLDSLAKHLARKLNLPGPGDVIEEAILKRVFGEAEKRIVGAERARIDTALSSHVEKGLLEYVNGPLKEQLLTELKENMPYEVTFVFGHTHKPFEQDANCMGYPEWINVYNSGGWVVDAGELQSQHGGAMILADENLNTVSLRMYNEMAEPEHYAVRVEEALHDGETNNPLYHRLMGLVEPAQEPWCSFSATVASSVSARTRRLREWIERSNAAYP